LERKDLESRRKTRKPEGDAEKCSVCVSEVRWKGQGEITSSDYTVYYCGGDRAERDVAIVAYKSIVKSVVKKSV
jgi:hypothetical protein